MEDILTGAAKAHTNIALIKYWGKIDENLNIPANDSISLTLDHFFTETEVTFSPEFEGNSLILNHNLVPSHKLKRVNRLINFMQKKYQTENFAKIKTINHVPTAAGLASSASGMAALAGACYAALDKTSNINYQEISKIARLGSGSASRSVFGGLVQWHRGNSHDSSFAEQLAKPDNLDLNIIAVIVNRHEKKIKSTAGMRQTSLTSPYYAQWVKEANNAIPLMKAAIAAHDFTRIGELSEQSASLMHATTLAANPAFTYFEPDTIRVIKIVQELRQAGIECYYTIDAGPNVKIICQSKNIKKITRYLKWSFNNQQIVVARPGDGIKISKSKRDFN